MSQPNKKTRKRKSTEMLTCAAAPGPEQLFVQDEFTDVALVVEGRRLFVCRGFLAMASPVFRRMFQSGFKEKAAKEIPLPEKKYDDILNFLKTISPNIFQPLTDTTVYSVLRLTDEYQVHYYKNRCAELLETKLTGNGPTDEELVSLIITAETYHLETLMDKCVAVAARRVQADIRAVDGFTTVTESTRRTIRDRRLDLLEGQLHCIRHDYHDRGECMFTIDSSYCGKCKKCTV